MLVSDFSFHQRLWLSISLEYIWEQPLHEVLVMIRAMSLGICMDPYRHVIVKCLKIIYTHMPSVASTKQQLTTPLLRHSFHCEAFIPSRHQNYHSLVTSRLLININCSFSSLFYWKNLQQLATSSLTKTLLWLASRISVPPCFLTILFLLLLHPLL